MNFLACDGTWSADLSGSIQCSGTLVSITGDEMRTELQVSEPLAPEDYIALRDWTVVLFVVVFGFLVLKKSF